MRIAVIEGADGGDYTEYIFSLIEEKANQLNFQLKTWSNSVPVAQQYIRENAIVYISFEGRSSFVLKWLYLVKIPSILKKIKADVVLHLNGMASSRIKIPQVIAVGANFFVNNKKQLSKTDNFVLQQFKMSQQIAANIVLYSTQKITHPLLTHVEKLQPVLFTAPGIFRTFEWHEKIMTKAQFADNKEYFLAIIADEAFNDFVLLLKGFSKFKKWQQSNMQLLVLPKYEAFSTTIREKHKTYKFRDDVQLLEDAEEKEIASLFASAYAFIHVSGKHPQLLILSIAMQCSLPVIAFNNEDVKEYCADSVLFCAGETEDALGNSLIELYKNENLHAQLKEAAGKQLLNLNRTIYADKLWQLLETLAKK